MIHPSVLPGVSESGGKIMSSNIVTSEEVTISGHDPVILSIDGFDDAVYVAVNNTSIVPGAGYYSDLSGMLKTGDNIIVISLYNDNRTHATGHAESPSRISGNLTAGGRTYNLSYSSGGPIAPGIVRQFLFLIKKAG
jgi:hypothetical protein